MNTGGGAQGHHLQCLDQRLREIQAATSGPASVRGDVAALHDAQGRHMQGLDQCLRGVRAGTVGPANGRGDAATVAAVLPLRARNLSVRTVLK